jgi:hypothetical protein
VFLRVFEFVLIMAGRCLNWWSAQWEVSGAGGGWLHRQQAAVHNPTRQPTASSDSGMGLGKGVVMQVLCEAAGL